MLSDEEVERLVQVVREMDRDELVRQIHDYPAGFPIDFTGHFLETEPIDRLRHVFVALCLQTKKLPPFLSTPSACGV